MSFQFFAPRGPHNQILKLPSSYRRTVRWLPRIGNIFPNFSVSTTQGNLTLWDWAEGHWVHLFSHPAAFTPVCTTELASYASMAREWKESNVKLFGLTGSSVDAQKRWHHEIEETFELNIDFPTAADPGLRLSTLFGMMHEQESTGWPIRKSFILDPAMRVQMIFEYPVYIGRNSEEILRVVRALQLRVKTGAATPADWYKGDTAIISDQRSESDVIAQFGAGSIHIKPYLRVVETRAT